MVGLGNKLSKAFSSIGKKTNKITTSIGNKVNSVIKEGVNVANVLEKKGNQVAGTLNNAYNDAANIVNKIPEYNEKAIRLSNNVIKKSGAITDVLRKSTRIGDRIIQGSLDLGGADIPILGSALSLAGKASSQLASGTKKLDQVRDNAQKKLDKYSEVSRGTINDIEKMNQRKKQEIAAQLENSDFAFA